MGISDNVRCKATLQFSLKKGQTPTQCSSRAKKGSELCGHHRNFVVEPTTDSVPPPPPMECSICIETITCNRTSFTKTPCKHFYHTKCLDKWKARSNWCPYCRASLTTGHMQTDKDRYNAMHEFIPPDDSAVIPRVSHPITQSTRFQLNLDQVRIMRSTVTSGSFEHNYYNALYQSMLDVL